MFFLPCLLLLLCKRGLSTETKHTCYCAPTARTSWWTACLAFQYLQDSKTPLQVGSGVKLHLFRGWRRIPYNMIVEGDIFKLRDGETFPCRAQRLKILPGGVVPTSQHFEAEETFLCDSNGVGLDTGAQAIGAFTALSTACLPLVRSFLQNAQRSCHGMCHAFQRTTTRSKISLSLRSSQFRRPTFHPTDP